MIVQPNRLDGFTEKKNQLKNILILQIEEEQFLLSELKKIEARKKERERKTQDLQKLISQADSQTETPRKTDKKLPKKKVTNPSRPSKIDTTVRFTKKKNNNNKLLIFHIFLLYSIFYRQWKLQELNFQTIKIVVFHFVHNV